MYAFLLLFLNRLYMTSFEQQQANLIGQFGTLLRWTAGMTTWQQLSVNARSDYFSQKHFTP